MPSTERVQQVQEVIIDHLKNVGAHDWEEVQKDFLDVPTSTFWRYVKKAKAQLEQPAAPSVPTDLFSQAEEKVEEPEPWDKPQLNSTYRLLRHAQRFYELHADILALRQQALDADGQIRDAQLFAKSIRLRNQLLKDELEIMDGVHATGAYTKVIDTIMEEVAKASPDLIKAVMVALHERSEEFKRFESKDWGHA